MVSREKQKEEASEEAEVAEEVADSQKVTMREEEIDAATSEAGEAASEIESLRMLIAWIKS